MDDRCKFAPVRTVVSWRYMVSQLKAVTDLFKHEATYASTSFTFGSTIYNRISLVSTWILLVIFIRCTGGLSTDTLQVGQSTSLSGVQSWLDLVGGLSDLLLLLRDNEFDVRWVGQVGVGSTVSSVGSSSVLRSLVHLDVGDLQLGNVQTLGLSVRLSVLQQVLDVVDGLGGPSGLLDTPLLTLGGSADRVVESSERNGSLVVQDIVQVFLSLLQVPSVDGLGGLSGVLERDSQVSTTSRGRLGWVDW